MTPDIVWSESDRPVGCDCPLMVSSNHRPVRPSVRVWSLPHTNTETLTILSSLLSNCQNSPFNCLSCHTTKLSAVALIGRVNYNLNSSMFTFLKL